MLKIRELLLDIESEHINMDITIDGVNDEETHDDDDDDDEVSLMGQYSGDENENIHHSQHQGILPSV